MKRHPIATDSGTRATSVVAIGGGHGTAVTLRAARRYADEITAIVSVADDGGSSGRLREELKMVALGDLRKCLVALADEDSALAKAFEHRFGDGALAGHALGNLVLAGMVETCGDLVEGIDHVAALVGAHGRVLPASTVPVVLHAIAAGEALNGQVNISKAGAISKVFLEPQSATPPPCALDAISAARQIVIGPGSLFTSVIAAAGIPAIAEAVANSPAQCVYVCNLHPQNPETANFTVADHVEALRNHGVRIDVTLIATGAGIEVGNPTSTLVAADLSGSNGLVHDPGKLANALCNLLDTETSPIVHQRLQ